MQREVDIAGTFPRDCVICCIYPTNQRRCIRNCFQKHDGDNWWPQCQRCISTEPERSSCVSPWCLKVVTTETIQGHVGAQACTDREKSSKPYGRINFFSLSKALSRIVVTCIIFEIGQQEQREQSDQPGSHSDSWCQWNSRRQVPVRYHLRSPPTLIHKDATLTRF